MGGGVKSRVPGFVNHESRIPVPSIQFSIEIRKSWIPYIPSYSKQQSRTPENASYPESRNMESQNHESRAQKRAGPKSFGPLTLIVNTWAVKKGILRRVPKYVRGRRT